jgi:prolyl-tRNA synthetase
MEELKSTLKQEGGIARIYWCGSEKCEDRLRNETGGKILNIPLNQHETKARCISCGEKAEVVVNFAKSY